MFDFIMSIYLLLFISMILSTVVGARPETMAKIVIDFLIALISIATKATFELTKLMLGIVELLISSIVFSKGTELEKKDSPFPRKPRRKLEN